MAAVCAENSIIIQMNATICTIHIFSPYGLQFYSLPQIICKFNRQFVFVSVYILSCEYVEIVAVKK